MGAGRRGGGRAEVGRWEEGGVTGYEPLRTIKSGHPHARTDRSCPTIEIARAVNIQVTTPVPHGAPAAISRRKADASLIRVRPAPRAAPQRRNNPR